MGKRAPDRCRFSSATDGSRTVISRHCYDSASVMLGDPRAVCRAIADLRQFMLRCGFSSFEFAERDPAIAPDLLAPYSNYYQRQ